MGAVWAVRVVFAPLVCILVVACHDKAPKARNRTPAESPSVTAGSTVRGTAPGCDSDQDCPGDHKCVEVTEQHGRACALAHPEHLVDSVGTPRWHPRISNVRPEFLGRLLLLKDVRVTVGSSSCTAAFCPKLGGGRARCCNRCSDSVEVVSDSSEASSQRLHGLRVVSPSGKPLSCGSRLDCEKPACPAEWALGRRRDLAGTIVDEGIGLSFRLASDLGEGSK